MTVADLNAVSIFVQVVDSKSFRAAARALDVPKSTVSLRVAQLEERLGTRLLDRTTRTVRLTEEGRSYYLQVAPALTALDYAERSLADLQSAPAGRLRVTAPFEMGQFVLCPIIIDYMRRYPAVELSVDLTDRRVNLVEDGFDLAVRRGSLSHSTFIARKLGSPDDLHLYASPHYLDVRGEPKSPEDLAEHDCLLMSGRQEPSRWKFRRDAQSIVVDVRARTTVNSYIVLRELAAAGYGITELPDYAAASAVSSGTLRPVLDEYRLPPLPWYAVYPSSRNVPPKLQAFINLLTAHFTAVEAAKAKQK
ncbi:LysR family transcriptional regulator [Pendulispora rubella]|uniref:LysR family transcriptional regulator n=1 Tax=Pendulispora rubella TaxID=2741070 RepID=A0ABZ2LC14_9BACT